MNFDVVTLFPGMLQGPLDDGMLVRARRAGLLGVRVHDLRRFGTGPQRQVDDSPFGGGPGMVLKPEPFFEAVASLDEASRAGPIVLLSARGRRFSHRDAVRLSLGQRLTLLCGHYKDVDQRVADGLATEEIAVGDFVLSGGEPAAI